MSALSLWGMKAGCAWAAGLVLVAAAASARADEVSGGDLLREHAHSLSVRMAPGHATLVVRRTLANSPRASATEGRYFVELPAGGVVTGMRVLGVVDDAPQWFPAALEPSDVAAALYAERPGSSAPREAALAEWSGLGRVSIRVFPIPPGAHKTIEYTVTAPTEYVDGRHVLHLPSSMTIDEVTPEAVVGADDARGKLFSNFSPSLRPCSECDSREATWPLAQGAHVRVAPIGTTIAYESSDAPNLEGAFASVSLRSGRAFAHARIEVARRISTVPRGAYVAVLLDTSRSMRADADAQIAAARAYLASFDDARVEVITFDRASKRRYGAFVPVDRAREDLSATKLAPKNGSNFDRALAEADAALASAPAGAARRIVLFTDLETRASLTPESARAKLARSGALLHVVSLYSGEASLSRDDDSSWAKLPRATGGVLWRGAASREETVGSRDVFEELARPKRIDNLEIKSAGAPLAELVGHPASMAEGQGWSEGEISSRLLTSIELVGEMWSTPMRRTLAADPAEGKTWAALAFGSRMHLLLEDAEALGLATFAGVVSPHTSLVFARPGQRPGMFVGGSVHLGGFHGSTHCRGIGHAGVSASFDHARWLRDALAPAWAACGASSERVKITIETTHDEIVDVRVHRAGAPADCIAEAAWALEPPEAFRRSHDEHEVEL